MERKLIDQSAFDSPTIGGNILTFVFLLSTANPNYPISAELRCIHAFEKLDF